MTKSLKKLKTLKDDLIVYPGHGAETSIGGREEKQPIFKELIAQITVSS